ncbi:MAG TPA: hypothetical protein VFW50_33630 [Streptosporangiaceae bacterium]|nr:hypothetical protein [Streptosporangiaceae bacterium]
MRASGPDGQPGGEEPGPDIRSRLRLALTEALKARDKDAASALRSALSAIVRAETAERQAAASQYERTGHAGQAAGMRQGTRALIAALDGPGGGEESG